MSHSGFSEVKEKETFTALETRKQLLKREVNCPAQLL